MRNRLLLIFGVAVFLAPLVTAQQSSQQPQQPAAAPAGQQPAAGAPAGRQGGRNSVQVGVPQGRGGGRGQTTGGVAGPRQLPPKAPPRNAAGRVLLGGATAKDHGVWIGGGGVARREDIPYQPWAKAVSLDRAKEQLEPHTRCKASGGMRQFLTPYGVEIAEVADIKRIFIFDIGGPHTFRTIYMDGRAHPKDLQPTYYGHSIGWWEGDTLVVDTIGYNESFWIDRGVTPHTAALHTVEKFTRTDYNIIKYDLQIDDPGAYTKPWGGTMNLRWENGTELFEYVCQQQNYAHELMVGEMGHVDRTTLPVP